MRFVVLGDPSLILFCPISSNEVRCLVDVPGQKVPFIASGEMANYMKTVVAPLVQAELHDAFISAIDSGSIRIIPNKSMPTAPLPMPRGPLDGGCIQHASSFNGWRNDRGTA